MYLISHVEIEGFWETYKFDVPIYQDVTFFIGQNGTGKTTFINLLAAALTADFRTLDLIPFKRISIILIPKIKGERPSITVNKINKKENSFSSINYHIVPKGQKAKEIKFSLDSREEQMMLRRLRHEPRYFEYYRLSQNGLTHTLRDLVKVNWLSIHRMSPQESARGEGEFESSIDRS